MHRIRTYSAIVLVSLGLCVDLAEVGSTAAQAGGPAAVSVAHSPRVCRSAKTWGPAPDAVRPCVRITGVEEDGSFSYEVSDASGTVRYTAGAGALDR